MEASESTKHFEDYVVGETIEVGSYPVTKEEIIAFAEQYDPQPFHIDENAARNSIFGGLIASGWHTAAICMRMLVENHLNNVASAGGRGVDELRWHTPLRPGDVLSVRMEIIEKRSLEDVPGLGGVHVRLTGVNQNDERCISLVLRGMIKQRDQSD
jgi:acyl dehydratase